MVAIDSSALSCISIHATQAILFDLSSAETRSAYIGLLSIPDHLLKKSSAWFIFSVARTSLVEEMPGQVSGLMRRALHEFWPQGGHGFQRGVCVPAGHRDVSIRCELAGILADEKALKEVFGYRGASGTKPCP